MPFTPYHLGIGLLLGVLLYKYLDIYSLLIGTVIVDIWPFSVLFFGIPYHLHGFSHSFIIAIIVSIILSFIRFRLNDYIKPKRSFSFIFLSSIIGTSTHVLLDAPLYSDMFPFWPSHFNPLFGLYTYSNAVLFSIICFILAGLIFIIKNRRKFYK